MTGGDTRLAVGGTPADELAETYGTPVYVYDADRIVQQYDRLSAAFAGGDHAVDIHYAMKANTNPAVVSTLTDLGAGLDCASRAEVDLALDLVDPEDIIYTAPYTRRDELAYAAEQGVTVNLDGAYLLDHLEVLPDRLCFRIDPGIGEGRHGLAFGGGDTKFGIDPEDAVEAYAEAKRRGVTSFGIHMMAGSGVLDPTYFERVTDRLLDIAASIAADLDITFEFVDVGGGLGIPYRPDESPLDVDTVGERVTSTFVDRVEDGTIGTPRLVIEPGRYLVGPAGVLLTEVTGIKRRRDRTFVGVDTGLHHLLRPMLLDAHHEVVPAAEPDGDPETVVDVVGPVCSTVDIIAADRPMPMVHTGDLLAIRDVGAYGYAMGSHFNSRPRPPEVLVDDGVHRLIRDREQPKDIFRGTAYHGSS